MFIDNSNIVAFGVFQVILSAYYSYLGHNVDNIFIELNGQVKINFSSPAYGDESVYVCSALKSISQNDYLYAENNRGEYIKTKIKIDTLGERNDYSYATKELARMTNFAIERFLRPYVIDNIKKYKKGDTNVLSNK